MRYLPLRHQDRAAMLGSIGVQSVNDLFKDVPPDALDARIDLPNHASEMAVERHLAGLAGRNRAAGAGPFFVGGGAYRHHIPASVDHIIQRGEFLTAYTPYQPEIAQGTLQYLFEFQSQVAALLGMDVANASLYDGSTATGEAVLMARRVTRKKKAILAGSLHPQYRDVVETMTKFTDDEVVSLAGQPDSPAAEVQAAIDAIDADTGCVVVQNPGICGHVLDLRPLAEACHAAKALLIVVVTEVVSLGLIETPGDMGADIVVAEGQSIGNGLNFGGPYLGLFATRQKYVRQMPGRLCGETVDADGNRGFVLTLSTREQHIRREKATSNICTNSGLCALAFTVHMSLLGGEGLRKLARLNHARMQAVKAALMSLGDVEILNSAYFNEICVRLPKPAAAVVDALVAKDVLAGIPLSRLEQSADPSLLLIAATEMVSDEDIVALKDGLAEVLA